MNQKRDTWVECYGHPTSTSLAVEQDSRRTHFVFDDTKDARQSFHVGLFLDYASTLNRRYLRYPWAGRIAVLCEPGSSRAFVERPKLARRFPWILTHDARLLDRGGPYVEFPFGTSWVSRVAERPEPFTKTKRVSFVGAPHKNAKGGHVLRNAVAEAMLRRPDVECFGRGIRWIDSKLDGLAEYSFSIAIENCDQDYYFTEKIVDCFLTDTVPIYWGCAGIERYFDHRGMIRFRSLDELLEILPTLNSSRYAELLPYVRANRQKAIDNCWATREGLFERIAAFLDKRYELARPILLRPRLVRGLERIKKISRSFP